MPTGQVFKWHLRIMMHPAAISGAVAKPNSSAPRIAAIATSRPVLRPPSAWTAMRPRRRLSTSVCCVSARPISHGEPACVSDARGDRADADFRHQLHGHVRLLVGVLQIADELRQVLDRIDVVVRRWRDQAHAGRRMTYRGDVLVDLVAGQLTAFAGLGALRDL